MEIVTFQSPLPLECSSLLVSHGRTIWQERMRDLLIQPLALVAKNTHGYHFG